MYGGVMWETGRKDASYALGAFMFARCAEVI